MGVQDYGTSPWLYINAPLQHQFNIRSSHALDIQTRDIADCWHASVGGAGQLREDDRPVQDEPWADSVYRTHHRQQCGTGQNGQREL